MRHEDLHGNRESAGEGGPDVRVGVVGLGLIGRQRARALQRIEGARLIATVDPVAEPEPETRGDAPVTHHRALEEIPVEDYDCAVIRCPTIWRSSSRGTCWGRGGRS